MKFNPDIHHRRSIRLKGYDYSLAGAYFITICVQGRECLFGAVVDGQIRLNDAGRNMEEWWLKLPDKFPGVALDEYVLMPNHFHGIITIVGAAPCGRPDSPAPCGRPDDVDCVGADPCVCPPLTTGEGEYIEGSDPAPGAHTGAPLHRMMQWFKTMTTNAYMRGVKEKGWPSFPGRLWQRNYYERIIRNDAEMKAVREYVLGNPANWADDEHHV